LLTEADAKPDSFLALGSPSADIVVSQPQDESDLGDTAEVVCEIFHRVVAREIHHSAN
jgi:hypothetical protein